MMHTILRFFLLGALLVFGKDLFAGCESVLVKYASSGQVGSQYLTFDRNQDECNATNTSSWSIGYEDELRYVSEQIAAGRIVLKIFQSGELSKVGKEVEQGLKALVVRPKAPTDIESIRQQAKFMALAAKELAAYQSKVMASIESRELDAEKINIRVELQVQEWDASTEDSRTRAMNALVNGQVAKEDLRDAIDLMTKTYPTTKEALELNQQKYDDLKKGMLSTDDVAGVRSRIEKDLRNFSQTKNLDTLSSISAIANRETNELRKRQYLNVLSEFVDGNGLVKSWVLATGQNLNLKSSPGSTEGQRLRNSANSILGAMVAKIADSSGDSQTIDRSQAAIDMIAMADEEVVSTVPGERSRGLSYVGYMAAFSGFETGANFTSTLDATKLSPNVASSIPGSESLIEKSGYERYVLVSTLNQLSAKTLSDPYFNLLVRESTDRALAAMESKLLPAFQAAVERIKSINEFQGGLLTGIYSGIADTVVQLAKMPGHILHPFDTEDAIVAAIVNYKGTWAAIRSVIVADYEKLANCGSNLRDCGEVVGKVSFQIGQLALGAGYLKGAAAPEVAVGVDAAASKLASQAADAIAKTADLGFSGQANFERALKIADPIDGTLAKLSDAVAGSERSGLTLGESAAELPKLLPAPYWPPNNGFLGDSAKKFIYPGELFDRYGLPRRAKFVSPAGVPFEARALPLEYLTTKPYKLYEVVKPFEVDAGLIAPWFNQPGLGTQYVLPVSLEVLLERGIVREIVR